MGLGHYKNLSSSSRILIQPITQTRFTLKRALLLTFLILCLFLARWFLLHTPQPRFRSDVPFKAQTPTWHTVFPGNLHVYTARIALATPTRQVHITALATLPGWFRPLMRCQCEFFSSNSTFLQEIQPADIEIFQENHMWDNGGRVIYASSQVVCDVPRGPIRYRGMRLNCQRGGKATHRDFLVENINAAWNPARAGTFAHCGAPLWLNEGSEDRPRLLVEFIEFYRALGVGKFVFYVTEVTRGVSDVLQYYRRLGLMEVVEWRLPGNVGPLEVWYHAQLAAMNDCLLRIAPDWDFMLNVDLDEFLVLHRHKDLPSFASSTAVGDCVVFNSTAMQADQVRQCSLAPSSLVTTCVSQRLQYIFPYGIRSKYFCRGRTVLEHGVHYPFATVNQMHASNRSADDLTLLHYRGTPLHYKEIPTEFRGVWVEENRAKTFSLENNLLERVNRVMAGVSRS